MQLDGIVEFKRIGVVEDSISFVIYLTTRTEDVEPRAMVSRRGASLPFGSRGWRFGRRMDRSIELEKQGVNSIAQFWWKRQEIECAFDTAILISK